jgi:hypothetical protein
MCERPVGRQRTSSVARHTRHRWNADAEERRQRNGRQRRQ